MSNNATNKKKLERKRNAILASLTIKAQNEPSYKNDIKLLNTKRRYDNEKNNDEYIQELKEIQEKFGIQPKERANYNELYKMIGMVLETGLSGTKVIRLYAAENGKDMKWVNEIAKPQVGKSFKSALDKYDEHEIITFMIVNKCYIKRDITNNKSVTGALTKLSKQLAYSNKFDDLEVKNTELQERLAIKVELSKKDAIDWNIGQQLRDSGLSVREVGDIIGASRSAVSKYTKPPKKLFSV